MLYKYFVLIVLLITLVLVSGCASQSGTKNITNPNISIQTGNTIVNNIPIKNIVENIKPDNSVTAQTKTDKCYYISNSTKLTYTEKDKEIEICYRNKYISFATSANRTDICDEITNPNYLGQCYVSIALQKRDYTICSDMKDMSYEAKGYYENLSSRDICYGEYAYIYMELFLIYDDELCNKLKNDQKKQECKDSGKAIKPPIGISAMAVAKMGDGLIGYFILENEDGGVATSDGIAKITLTEVDYSNNPINGTLIIRTLNITKSDYVYITNTIYRFKFKFTELERQLSGNYVNLIVEFATPTGQKFLKTGRFNV